MEYFNEAIKKSYLEFLNKTTILVVERIFRQAAATEEMYGKDLYDWNYDEIVNFYRMLVLRSGSTIYNINSQLKKYTDYCITRNLVADMINHYYEIDDTTIYRTCSNVVANEKMLFTRKELLTAISAFENPGEKYLYLALFEGICGKDKEELYSVHKEDIDGNVITLSSGRKLTISKELINIIYDACDTYVYHGVDKNDKPFTRPYIAEMTGAYKSINRQSKTQSIAHLITIRMDKIGNENGCKTTAKSLLNAGRIEMCKKIMSETHCSFEEALRDKDVVYRYGDVVSLKQFVLKYENLLGEL